MRFRVLGPVDVDSGAGPVTVAAAKERTLLAILLAEANRSVAAATLIDELWGDHPPKTADKTLQTYVSHLRRIVGDRLTTDPVGYRLRVERGELDVHDFDRLIGEGRLALLRAEQRIAATLLREALDLWRGDAYAGVWSESVIRTATVRLEELRLRVTEDLLDARLAGDQHAVAVADLEALVAEHPARERLWGLLMTALDRDGRRADALRAYQRARTHLLEEVGIEPGPEIRAIERAILDGGAGAGDPATTHPGADYVENADGLRIAYWVTGGGERDVVFCAEVFHNLEILSELKETWAFLEPLARSARLIAVQRRGTGLSDRDPDGVLVPPERCVGDLDAVLDEVGSRSASLVGWGHGGQVALAYAAARPERVDKVVVVNSYPLLAAAPDYPDGVRQEVLDLFTQVLEHVWGTQRPLGGIFDPRSASDAEVIRRVSRFERLVATPREAAELRRQLDHVDIRPLLPQVPCPVLVVFLTGSLTGEAGARWLVEHLPNGEYLEAPGYFVPHLDDAAALATHVDRFLELSRHRR